MRHLWLIAVLLCVATTALATSPGTLKIEALSESVYRHISYKQVDGYGLVPSNGLIVLQGDHSVLIDTPWSAADTLSILKWAKQQQAPVTASISTHWHADRTAGIEALNAAGVDTYATVRTNEILHQQGLPQALHVIEQNPAHWQALTVFYPGAGHAKDNIVVWLPHQKVLAGGCLVKSLDATTLGYTGDADILHWPEAVESVKQMFAPEIVVPGHGEPGSVDLLTHTQMLANAIIAKSEGE